MNRIDQDIIPVVSNKRTKEVVYKPVLEANIGNGQTLGDFITGTQQAIKSLQEENSRFAAKISNLSKEHNKLVKSHKKQIKALKAQIIELQESKK